MKSFSNYAFLQKLLILSLVLLSACTKYTTVRHTADFDMESIKRANVALMPAEAEINLVEFGSGKKRLDDYEYNIEQVVKDVLLTSFHEQGFKISFLSRKDLHMKGLLKDYLRTKEALDELIVKLYKIDRMPVDKAFQITDKVNRQVVHPFYEQNYQYLVFPLYGGHYATNGARMANYLLASFVGSAAAECSESQSLLLAIVNTQNGEIVWTNKAFNCSSVYFSFEQIGASNEELDYKYVGKVAKANLSPLFTPEEKK